jgi:subtilisin-like proprotein convertase family protein
VFGHLRWLGAVIATCLASCGVEEKTDLTGTGGSAGATSGGGGTGASGGAGGTGATGGGAGQTNGGTGGIAGAVNGGTAGAAGTPAGGTGGIVDPCAGACTDANATCSGGGTCDCNSDYLDVDGNPQSADCKSTIVTSVSVTLGITHERCGELVIKLGGPNAVTMTLMSRPGENESSDNGQSGGSGDGSPMTSSSPVTFDDAATPGSESMGQGPQGEVVCQDTGVCSYNPDQGAAGGPTTLDGAYGGSTALGLWRVCVGDVLMNDTGTLESFSVDITTSNHSFTGAVTGLAQNIPDNGYDGTLGSSSVTCADVVIP